jgi:hypothetical protein
VRVSRLPSFALRVVVLPLAIATTLLSVSGMRLPDARTAALATRASASEPALAAGNGCRLSEVTRFPRHVRGVVHRHHYKILGESDVRTRKIRAVTAIPLGRGDGHGIRVFFFKSGHFVGTDSKAQSFEVTINGCTGRTVELRYAMLVPDGSGGCAPNHSSVTRRFKVTPHTVRPLKRLPPTHGCPRR